MDLSSAFDTIDHAVLFDPWQDTFGISGTAVSLLKSYLCSKHMYMYPPAPLVSRPHPATSDHTSWGS